MWCEGSRDSYGDMKDFIEALSEEERVNRLSIAISGRGAFCRFKDVLDRWPGELEAWYRVLRRAPAGPCPSLARRCRVRTTVTDTRPTNVSRGTLRRSGRLRQGAHPRTGAVPQLWFRTSTLAV